MDAIFAVDIVLNFFSAFEDTNSGQIVTNLNIIAKTYVRGWFLIDLVSTIPFEAIFSKNLTILRTIKILRFLKILRLQSISYSLKFRSVLLQLQHAPAHPSTYRVFKVVLSSIIVQHWW